MLVRDGGIDVAGREVGGDEASAVAVFTATVWSLEQATRMILNRNEVITNRVLIACIMVCTVVNSNRLDIQPGLNPVV